jgi:hypothetical protein
MMCGCVVLGVIIALVIGSGAPVDEKLSLIDAITNPVKTHFHCAGSALFDGVVGNPGGGRVVCFDRCRRLWMAELVKGCAKDSCFLSVDEEATDFRLGSGGHDRV